MIGTAGMILSAFIHMIMTLIILQDANHSAYLGVYPVFITFLMIGTFQIYIKKPIIN